MLLAETPYAEQIRADVGALKTLFITLFFASVGMLADVDWIVSNVGLVVILAFAMIVGKAVIAYVAVRLFKQTIVTSLATAIALAQVGEFSFVLVQIASNQKMFTANAVNLISSSAVISLIAGSFLVASSAKIARWLAKRFVFRRKLVDDIRHTTRPKMRNHVVVIGYGESGQAAAQPISEAGYKLFVLDVDPRLVKKAKSKGITARIGDASLGDILDGASIETSRAVVITIPDHRTSRIVIHYIKKHGPGVFIAARARYRAYVDDLLQAGADCVVDESLLTGTRLGEGVLQQTQDPDDPSGPTRL
jgi:CPA2 family monovalent cation:H+ antiporter-2